MDRSGTIKLLKTVMVNYPAFRRHIETEAGGISEMVIDEWQRQLGYLEVDEALERLDMYMATEAGSRAPKAMDLKLTKPGRRDSEIFHDTSPHRWHLEFSKRDPQQLHGRLYDEECREYSHDPLYEDGYHYDASGHICTMDGRVVFA